MKKKSNFNWAGAKAEYISSRGVSLKDISIKYGMSISSIKTISSKENWAEEKQKRWDSAEKSALEEVEGSIKDLIVRHAKVARFLQAGGLTHLKKIVEYFSENPDMLIKGKLSELAKMIQALYGMAGEGLKAERELYPKQIKFEGDVDLNMEGLSKELEEAIYESFRKKLGRKRESIHKGSGQKKAITK